MKPDPMGERRNPFQVYMVSLSIVAGIPSALGEPPSGSVSSALDSGYLEVWGCMLLLGGLTAMMGMFWQGSATNGLFVKRFGLLSLGIANMIFGLIILQHFAWDRAYVALTMLGFAGACFLRAWYVSKHIKALIRRSTYGDDHE